MSNKPEALILADELDKTLDFQHRAWDAAKELRRLHEANAELLEALKWVAHRCPAGLIEHVIHPVHREAAHDAGACARAAIAKHGAKNERF